MSLPYMVPTIPHILAVLSAIDIVGYLIGKGKPKDTFKNVESFFKGIIDDVATLHCLVFVYRHGMSHSVFLFTNHRGYKF